MGVAMNSNNIYDTPSKSATILNIFKEENILIYFFYKNKLEKAL